jgi:penicillin-binding protein 1A
MGRDDAKPVGGLQGGTAPARAFHDFMVTAVANRPVEQFETEVPMPDWQLEPEEQLWGANEVLPGDQPLVDADGNPLPAQPADPLAPPTYGERLPPGTLPDQTELDRIFGGTPPPREGALPPAERVPARPSAPPDPPDDGSGFAQ